MEDKYDDSGYLIDLKIPPVFEHQGVRIHYVNKEEMEDSEHVYHQRSDGDGYNLLRFKDNKVSTITMLAPLKGCIFDIFNLFYILSVVPSSAGQRFPPGTITSLRRPVIDAVKKGKKRPAICRGEIGGSMKNFYMFNIWTSDSTKYVNGNFSKKNIFACGVRSEEVGEEAIGYFVAHIKDAMIFHSLVKANVDLFRESAQWIIERSKGNKIEDEYYDMENDVMVAEDYQLVWTTEKYPNSEDYFEKVKGYFVQEIYRRCLVDIFTINELKCRIEFIINIPAIASPNIATKRVARSMYNVNYNINLKMSRVAMTCKLRELGYDASFDNMSKPEIKISTNSPVNVDSSEIVRRDMEYIKQTFFIYHHQSILHSSAGGKSAEDRYYDFMTNLILLDNELNPHLPMIPTNPPQEGTTGFEKIKENNPEIMHVTTSSDDLDIYV